MLQRERDSSLHLGGVGEVKHGSFTIRRRQRLDRKLKPHLIFSNWKNGYQVPLVCFLEIAMLVIYLITGLFHQDNVSILTQDFSTAVDGFFLSGLVEMVDDRYPATVPIYRKKRLLNVTETIAQRFFEFPMAFPCGDKFHSHGYFTLTHVSTKDKIFEVSFAPDNISFVGLTISFMLEDFKEITMSCPYVMETVESIGQELVLTVTGNFLHDLDTNIITLDFTHTRNPRMSDHQWSNILAYPFISFPLLNSFCAVVCIIITLLYMRSLYYYTQEKASRDFEVHWHVFWKKIDRWAIYGIVCHLFTITGNIMYCFSGRSYVHAVPVSTVFMTIASFMHCILLIRYLRQKESTMLIVNVIYRAMAKILLFLMGCLFIFVSYVILGCCLFGTYDETFQTVVDGARALIAVIHGDSIQNMFDSAEKRPNITVYAGFFYWAMWVFFSLTIMFNISISIFEEVLTSEIRTMSKENEDDERDENIGQFQFVLPIDYRKIF